jgi:hypothetical protein
VIYFLIGLGAGAGAASAYYCIYRAFKKEMHW